MFNFDINKFMADKTRLVQLLCLAGMVLFALITVIVEAGFIRFLFLLTVLAFAFVSIVPVFLALLDVGKAPVGRSAYFGLKAAEAAGWAGVAMIILGVFTAISFLTNKGFSAHLTAYVIFIVQILSTLGMAVGVGLTSLIRAGGVELELPPEPEPKPAPVQAPPQGFAQGYPQQPYPPQGYPQQPYPPQGYPQQAPQAPVQEGPQPIPPPAGGEETKS